MLAYFTQMNVKYLAIVLPSSVALHQNVALCIAIDELSIDELYNEQLAAGLWDFKIGMLTCMEGFTETVT